MQPQLSETPVICFNFKKCRSRNKCVRAIISNLRTKNDKLRKLDNKILKLVQIALFQKHPSDVIQEAVVRELAAS